MCPAVSAKTARNRARIAELIARDPNFPKVERYLNVVGLEVERLLGMRRPSRGKIFRAIADRYASGNGTTAIPRQLQRTCKAGIVLQVSQNNPEIILVPVLSVADAVAGWLRAVQPGAGSPQGTAHPAVVDATGGGGGDGGDDDVDQATPEEEGTLAFAERPGGDLADDFFDWFHDGDDGFGDFDDLW
jgi:hypothetical protein